MIYQIRSLVYQTVVGAVGGFYHRLHGFLPYLLGLLMVISLKLYSDQAGSDELIWILRPTAWWTSTLSGFPFTYQQGVGYINHSLRFIIAPACAGLRFLMIACLMLI